MFEVLNFWVKATVYT